MPKSEWLKRADIYIDGFHNFSTIEYLIKGLIKYAKSVTIILATMVTTINLVYLENHRKCYDILKK